MQITRYHLDFLDECIAIFDQEPRRDTHINEDGTLIGLRYGVDRDSVRIFHLDTEVAFFANLMKKTPLFYALQREEVRWFADLMEKQLQANEHKGGWLDSKDQFLMIELKNNLLHACDPNLAVEDVTRRLVNVSNFAMMIADKLRAPWERPL